MGDYGYYGKKAGKHKPKRFRRSLKHLNPKGSDDDGAKKQSKQNRVSFVMRIADIVMLCLSVLCIIALLLAFLARFVNPNTAWVPAFAALVYPFLFIAQLILLLYWLVRWKVNMIIIMGLMLLTSLPSVKLFMRPVLTRQYDNQKRQSGDIRIMSFNVMGFDMKVPDNEGLTTAELIFRLIGENRANIVCMQEYKDKIQDSGLIDSILQYTPYSHIVSYDITYQPGGKKGLSHAIYSKYPIINSGFVDVDSVYVRSVWVDLKIKNDTVRVISNHLQNTQISGDDRDYLVNRRAVITDGNIVDNKIIGIINKLIKNYRKRARQAELIARFRNESPYKTIVCGDFNDTPLSYVYRTISRGMTDAFAVKGRGGSSTYHGLFDLFRIDYIFFSRGFTVKRFHNYDIEYSDHTPISAIFEINEFEGPKKPK